MLRPTEAWVGVVEREKKAEGVGRRAEQIGDEGAWGGSAGWSAEQISDEGWPASCGMRETRELSGELERKKKF